MAKNSTKKQTWYRQCTFTAETEGGTRQHTAWIPESFAVLGKSVYFGKKTNNPEPHWKVISVGDMRKSGDYIGAHERDYLKQRAASDI